MEKFEIKSLDENTVQSNKEIKETYISSEVLNNISEQLKVSISNIEKNIFKGDINIFESMKEMKNLSKKTMASIISNYSNFLNSEDKKLPFAMFFFGSSSRNSMLPNSDLDVGIVFEENCPQSIKESLRLNLGVLPFDKIDILNLDSINKMKKENCPDMIEYNKIMDAEFIGGNSMISDQYTNEIKKTDTKDEKIKRFITEYKLFNEYDYLKKKTEHGDNLKYSAGSSRDIIFLDWYFNMMKNKNSENYTEPLFKESLNLLGSSFLVSEEHLKDLNKSIEIILLVKFTLLSQYKESGDSKYLYANDYSLSNSFEKLRNQLSKFKIENPQELLFEYGASRNIIADLVERIAINISDYKPEISLLWKTAQEKKVLDSEVISIIQSKNWMDLAPFAIKSTSSNILEYLTDTISNEKGFEYILRIISQNDNITETIKQKLLNSNMEEKYKLKLINKKL